jgi:actin-like ATPase involved in cell morphogenesis
LQTFFNRARPQRLGNVFCHGERVPLANIHHGFCSLGTDLAIDLGTANTCVFALGKGVVSMSRR